MPAPALTLVTGPEEVLAERAVDRLVAAVRSEAPDAERRVVDLSAEGAAGRVAGALAPSLFGDRAVVVARGAEAADEAAAAALRAAMAAPVEGVWLVVVHAGGARGRGLVDAARRAGAQVVDCPAVKRRRDLVALATSELRALRRTATPRAVEALVDALGPDVRLLLAACAQLAHDAERDPIDVDVVALYFGGVTGVTGFEISDAVWERRSRDALRALRWAAEGGDRARLGPATVGAVAAGLRALVRYAGARRVGDEAAVAAEAGVPPWKLRALRAQLAHWRPDQLAAATVLLAEADAAVKGGLRDGDQLDAAQKLLALERAVLRIAGPPQGGDGGR